MRFGGVIHDNVRHARDFLMVGNHLGRNVKLSPNAIGLSVHIQNVPEGGEISVQSLYERFRESGTSKATIAKGLRELEEHGYLSRIVVQDDEGQFATVTISHNYPARYRNPADRELPPLRRTPASPVTTEILALLQPTPPTSADLPPTGAEPPSRPPTGAEPPPCPPTGDDPPPTGAEPPSRPPTGGDLPACPPTGDEPPARPPVRPSSRPSARPAQPPMRPPAQPPVRPPVQPPVRPPVQPSTRPPAPAQPPAATVPPPRRPRPAPARPRALPPVPQPLFPARALLETAWTVVAGLRREDPRLLVSETDAEHLTSGVAAWLERDLTPEDVTRALAHDLPPDPLYRPAALIAHRLTHDLPPLPSFQPPTPPLHPLQNCDKCDRAHRAPQAGPCPACTP
ncbi:hypothetical protein ACIQRS_09045 [Streptomyces termitum]